MLFNSLEFPLFFGIFAAIYYPLPRRARLFWLFAGSSYFYAVALPKYLTVLYLLIAVDYAAGRLIEKSTGRLRFLFFCTSLSANLGALFFFKYRYFFDTQLSSVLGYLRVPYAAHDWSLLLPIGLSFHTFQSMSYIIEVYFGRQRAERDLLNYSTYVLFWPQLVAGPIERPGHLLPQIRAKHPFDVERVTTGLKWMLAGYLKKVVIADRLALYVNTAYGTPSQASGWTLLVATYFFSIQIYCDFSGYTDIARGCAALLGYKLSPNFDMPYLSRSLGEFWRRWHISLSSWFRDYVYIPLGGNRSRPARHRLNLMLVFLASGLWHGANWTYVFWGGLHGGYLIVENLFRDRLDKLGERWAVARTLITFHLVTFAWIFFRAGSVTEAMLIIKKIACLFLNEEHSLAFDLSGRQILSRGCLIAALLGAELWFHRPSSKRAVPPWIRWSLYYGAALTILAMGIFEETKFIYFQF